MLTPLDHTLAVVLAVLFPIRAATLGFRRLRRAAPADLPQVRLSVYRQAMLVQWLLAASTAGLWLVLGRPWTALGVVPRLTGGLAGVGVGLGIVAVLMVRQQTAANVNDESLERLRERMGALERMLPATRRELSWFYALAATAGVCEELLYRGYLIWYFGHFTGFFGFTRVSDLAGLAAFGGAALASSVLFGFGHAYQGWRGMALTTAVGLFLAAVYWVTRSLAAPALIHALMDAHAGHVMRRAYARARERGQEGMPWTTAT
ncbi:MAG: CPBP family intramembrane metalloprotease [Candidatus Eisenbacteria bacterium]|nr:CPBP family intramembrane metalloprotease [Candidatus Eisenbacteria bacterium]